MTDTILLVAASVGHDLPLLSTLAAGFTAALVLGIVTQRIGMSPIVGYLLAGILIGPYTPGFVGDLELASQLAEFGVILLMFGVGLNFHLKELLAVKRIAVPGAVFQSATATVLAVGMALSFGWDAKTGVVIGFALAVASTVVLIRVLMDNGMLETVQGRIAVGWLVVEDIFTVVVLVLIPALGASGGGETELVPLAKALAIALIKLAVLVTLILTVGAKIIPWMLVQVARLRSRELFTLCVMVLAVALAAGAAKIFGVSMALSAFLAGMAVGQSPASQQAAADALPLRDAFAVIFFVSIGMLFNPMFVVEHPLWVMGALVIVIIGKPLAALVIVAALGYTSRTALTVAIALSQVGEFSFILGALSVTEGLITEEQFSLIVACALISITMNPMVFRKLDTAERFVDRTPWLSNLLNFRAKKLHEGENRETIEAIKKQDKQTAVIVGYGPVGRTADRLLRAAGLESVVIDMNMDTVTEVRNEGRQAIYGDATREQVLAEAGLDKASFLVITLPHSRNRGPLIVAARELNPDITILVRARYLNEEAELRFAGASDVCIEEAEAAIVLAQLTLRYLGAGDEKIEREVNSIRESLKPRTT